MITTAQASAITGLSIPRIKQLCQSGDIKAAKIGRDWMIDEKSVAKMKKEAPQEKGDKPT